MAYRSPHGVLPKESLLDAALDLIDREGIDSLTIRRLAKELGRAPMSLYSHFRSKKELLDLAYGRLVERLLTTPPNEDWHAELEATCHHLREVLLAHPNWISLLTRVRPTPSALAIYERILNQASRDGLRPEAAFYALSAVLEHALGAVLVERMLSGDPSVPHQRLEAVRAMLSELPPTAYPRVAATTPQFDRWSFERVFDLGCHALVTGLDQIRDATRRRVT